MIYFFSFIFGYVTAKVFAGQNIKSSGPFGSLILPFKKIKIHVHHWIMGLLILSAMFLGKSLVGMNFTELDFTAYFYLTGIIVQGIVEYKDWKEVVIKG